jgi:hypothetical protein
MWTRATATVLAAATMAGCNRGAGADKAGPASAEARADSSREASQALRDSGVSVDTQTIDTGTARTTPAEDN